MSRWLAVTLAVAATACTSHHILPAASCTAPPKFEGGAVQYNVGVARADITPPPGVSTFGHGEDSRVTHGFWTRLYCRVFVFRSEKAALAIVPCDLPSMSQLLQRRVIKELNALGVDLPASRLMLTATHTHAGPAHFYNGEAYGGLASTQLPGYDDEMVSFLSKRIADAIRRAYKDPKSAELRWTRSRITDLTHNRDMSAFLRNGNVPVAEDCGTAPSEECAVDRDVAVLEVIRAHSADAGTKTPKGCPLGWLTFFAMHPTVLPNTNQLLGADSFGIASRTVEAHLRDVGRGVPGCPEDPLGGIINTDEGDTSSRRSSGSVEEAVSIGARFGEEIISSVNDNTRPFASASVVSAAYVEVDMRSNKFCARNSGVACPQSATCDEPEFGVMGGFGANDHPTFITTWMPDDPRDDTRTDCQAPKRPFPLFANQSKGKKAFPSVLPYAVVRIDDELIDFVPGELTYASGERVRTAVQRAVYPYLPIEKNHVLIGGLANGYIQYVTTREEYDAQGYEGASNLFGPASQELIANISAALAKRLFFPSTELPGKLDVARPYEYWIGPERARFPRQGDDPTLEELGKARHPIKMCSLRGAAPMAVCFAWVDGAPGSVRMTDAPWVGLVAVSPPPQDPPYPDWQPSLAGFNLNRREKLLIDDRSADFRTRIHFQFGDGWLWTTIFRPRPFSDASKADPWGHLRPWGALQLRADVGTSHEISSDRFMVDAPPQPCSAELQRLCGE